MEKIRNGDDIMPSATANAEEIRRWQALPRDEQLEHMKTALNQAADGSRSFRTMQDIKYSALKRIAMRGNG